MQKIAKKLAAYFKTMGVTQEEIATQLGVTQQYVSGLLSGKKGFGKKQAQRFSAIWGISPSWLLTGDGEMLIGQEKTVKNYEDEVPEKTYPLIPIDAVAGFGTDDSAGVRCEDCDQYMIPDFDRLGVEFLIRVSGSSMYPTYNNGDVLACRKINEVLFFQWGKVYVIDSSQGALVKRVYEDADKPENIICVSENKENYPPFSMPISDIRSLSIVVGVVRIE